MVATAEPKLWVETLFCSAVAASGGMQPKPEPSTNSSTSNSGKVMLGARHAITSVATIATAIPQIGMRL